METLDWLDRLTRLWRSHARSERERQREDLAQVWERAVEEVLKAEAEWERTPLRLADAAKESGYTYQGLRKMVEKGDLRNIGRPGPPFYVLRGDLPRKARRMPINPQLGGDDG